MTQGGEGKGKGEKRVDGGENGINWELHINRTRRRKSRQLKRTYSDAGFFESLSPRKEEMVFGWENSDQNEA